MGKKYYKLLLGAYALALLVCGASRILLKLRFMDPETGFYTVQNGIVTVFNVTLLLAVAAMFVMSRLHVGAADYGVHRPSRTVGVLTVLSGAAILLFTMLGNPYPELEQGYSDTLIGLRGILALALGLLAGASMIWTGMQLVTDTVRRVSAFPALFGCIWQLYMLVTRFNSYTVLTTISDNLLAVLFMLFASLYLIGHARMVYGLARKDGRNYVLPAGLATSLLGLLLVLPNYLWAARGGGIPAPLLDPWESVYALLLAVQSLAFVLSTVRSIQQV